MQISLNGAPYELPEAATAAALIEALQLGGRRVALELNGEVVPRSRWPEVVLASGDRAEVVHAIGGG